MSVNLIEVARFHCDHLDVAVRNPHTKCCPEPDCDGTLATAIAECAVCGDVPGELAVMRDDDPRIAMEEA
jgi:hypothetical protein